MNWTKKWPEEEGWYWVYGITYKGEDKLELSVMKVMKASNAFMYIRNGNFYYKSEAGPIMFHKIEEPETPYALRFIYQVRGF